MSVPSSLLPSARYDIIGDIHGHATPLRNLLEKLGYFEADRSYQHPEGRKVLFLGDFIDRGPEVRNTLHLVRAMTEARHALAVMGNHEYNAVCFHTPDENGGYLRSRTSGDGQNEKQHRATLDAFKGREDEWRDWLGWFKRLPFSLDLGGIRAVHATWSPKEVAFLSDKTLEDPAFLHASAEAGTPEFLAIETLLKGVEAPLPKGYSFPDKQGIKRTDIRVRWWERPMGKTYRQLVFPESPTVPDVPVPTCQGHTWNPYPVTDKPVFFGHYWLPPTSPLAPVSENAACLDYSVATAGGRLVAYRWDGETRLRENKFVQVPA
jgi:hypothetical protein